MSGKSWRDVEDMVEIKTVNLSVVFWLFVAVILAIIHIFKRK
jgi:hypothetical protein